MNWIKLEIEKPERNRAIIVKTPYCKYPFCTAFWNGVDLISIDEYGTVIWNVEYWANVEL